MQADFRKLALLVLVCGVILRISLAVVNRAANDDHVSVAKVIAFENRIPEPDELMQAYHPKLYHGTAALLIKLGPRHWPLLPLIVSQLVSCVAGIWTLLLAYRFFMKEIEASDKVRFITFSLLALNPALIGINGQATNDSFVILFGSLAFYFGWHFFQSQRTGDFCWMSVFSILAALSKLNGVIIFIAIVAVFGIALCRTTERNLIPRGKMAIYGLIFLASYLVLVPTLGPYGEEYRLHGTPLRNNAFYKSEGRLPFTLPNDSKPGETSIVRALFTFPLINLVKTPIIPVMENGHPENPTSLWGELYGRTHFVHYDAWPASWRVPKDRFPWAPNVVQGIGRVILILALLPTVLMLMGLLKSCFSAARRVVSARLSDGRLTEWFLVIFTIGYILFIVALRIQFKDFGAMKAIYIFPGLIGFFVFFQRDCERFYAWCSGNKVWRRSADGVFAGLIILYVVDITIIIGQLSYNWVFFHLLRGV